MRRYGLRDDQWERIEHLLPGKEGDPGATAKNNRLFVFCRVISISCWHSLAGFTGVFWGFSGCSYPPYRWSEKGVWKQVFDVLASDADNEYAAIDATILRAHQRACGCKKKHPQIRAKPKP